MLPSVVVRPVEQEDGICCLFDTTATSYHGLIGAWVAVLILRSVELNNQHDANLQLLCEILQLTANTLIEGCLTFILASQVAQRLQEVNHKELHLALDGVRAYACLDVLIGCQRIFNIKRQPISF